MKKVLYGTTALVAASMVTAGAASAADRIKIKVGGYYQSVFVVQDQDNIGGIKFRNTAVEQEGEIHFKGETTLDNGLTVGVQVQLEARQDGDQIDEHYVYLEGGWGRFVIGAENSGAYLTGNWAPSAIVGHGVDSPNFLHHQFVGGATTTTAITRTSDTNKVTYFTPRIGGFQIGASYTPEASRRGGHPRNFGSIVTENTQLDDIFEIGGNFKHSWDEVSFTLTGGYLTGDGANNTINDWRAGAEIGFGGFTIGGSYSDRDGDGQNTVAVGTPGNGGFRGNDIETFSIGATYGTGPWTFGAGWLHSEVDNQRDEYDAIEVGGTYALGPGVNVSAGVQFFESDGTVPAGGIGTLPAGANLNSETTAGFLVLGLGF